MTRLEFMQELHNLGQDQFIEYDRQMARMNVNRIDRLGRSKAFHAGWSALANIWVAEKFPEEHLEKAED